MRKLWWLLCVVITVGLVSNSFGVEKILLGDFESSPSSDGRYDGWWGDGCSIVSVLTPGVTRGTHALKCTSTASADFWGPGIQVNLNGMADSDSSGVADAVETATADEACLVVDYTAFVADYTAGTCQLGFVRNCAAASGGWDKSETQDMVLDGETHRMVFVITETTKEKILEGITGWGSNIGLFLNVTGPGPVVYFDNIWLLPTEPEDEYLPHEPSIDETKVGTVENATFNWLAATDPNTDSGLAVDPNIVDQYVFLNDGNGGVLYYIGKTGVDPEDTPESQYGPVTLNLNSTYQWAVVEAMAGYEQVLTSSSTLDDVDPNNLIGPVWEFSTISTVPAITSQPVNGRAALGAKNVEAFTVGVAEPDATYYQWYNSTDNVIDNGNDYAITSASGTTMTPIFATGTAGITMSYQKYYYCKLYNETTVSGGGSAEDVYTDVVAFIPERIVAQYDFENALTDSAPITTDRHNGTGVNSPTYVTGVTDGTYALSLNGTSQYVTLGTTAYPKAVLADGIGGGMDIGSVMCWVKATQDGTILGDADPNATIAFQIADGGASTLVTGIDGTQAAYGANPYYTIINDGNWHLLAATWDMDGEMKLYVDATNVTGETNSATFSSWANGMLIGAGRNTIDPTVIESFFGGYIDNLRVYNYIVTPETIAQEYYDVTGNQTCIYPEFTGSTANLDDEGSSYCQIDLADFAVIAESWLKDGYYPEL